MLTFDTFVFKMVGRGRPGNGSGVIGSESNRSNDEVTSLRKAMGRPRTGRRRPMLKTEGLRGVERFQEGTDLPRLHRREPKVSNRRSGKRIAVSVRIGYPEIGSPFGRDRSPISERCVNQTEPVATMQSSA
jgi:hypothetical protein